MDNLPQDNLVGPTSGAPDVPRVLEISPNGEDVPVESISVAPGAAPGASTGPAPTPSILVPVEEDVSMWKGLPCNQNKSRVVGNM